MVAGMSSGFLLGDPFRGSKPDFARNSDCLTPSKQLKALAVLSGIPLRYVNNLNDKINVETLKKSLREVWCGKMGTHRLFNQSSRVSCGLLHCIQFQSSLLLDMYLTLSHFHRCVVVKKKMPQVFAAFGGIIDIIAMKSLKRRGQAQLTCRETPVRSWRVHGMGWLWAMPGLDHLQGGTQTRTGSGVRIAG